MNPVAAVQSRRISQKLGVFLKADEIQPTLALLSACWRPIFTVSTYAGLRKGELGDLESTTST